MEFLMSISSFLAGLIGIYSFLVIVDIFTSWFPRKNEFFTFLDSICRPYLNVFSKTNMRIGMFDFSPIFALMILNVVQSILSTFGSQGIISLGIILAMIINMLWSYLFSFLIILFIILLIARLFLISSSSPNKDHYIDIIDKIIDRPICNIQKTFFKKRIVNDKTIVTFSLVLSIVAYFILKYGISALVGWLMVV